MTDIGSDIYVDDKNGMVVINESGVPNDAVMRTFGDHLKQHPELSVLATWANGNYSLRYQGHEARDRFLSSDKIFDQFRTARWAMERDETVAGVAETTEQLIFNQVHVDCDEEDEENLWNQIAKDINLRTVVREIWREYFSISQCYVGVYWGNKTYKLTGKSISGNRRKKEYRVRVPLGVTMIDPTKILPMGTTMFKKDQLLYLADDAEADAFDKVIDGTRDDPIVRAFIREKVDLFSDRNEIMALREWVGNVPLHHTYYMNTANVFRFTATKPDYQRFAEVRMRSVFDLLDLKHQLKQMDRAHLIGAANFIVLVKKGSDKFPAQDAEIQALATQVKTAARIPLIVGDHRLEVEIVTPKTDKTLAAERYNAIDSRITSRLYNILASGNYASGVAADDSVKLLNVIARSLEAKRQDIGDFLERTVFDQILKRNQDTLVGIPKLTFRPKRVGLSQDIGFIQALIDMHSSGDLSLHTLMDELDLDFDTEARLKKLEKEKYEKIFMPKELPQNDPKVAGKLAGGNKNGGGDNPDSPTSSPGNRPSRNPDQVNNDNPGKNANSRIS